MSRLFTFLFLVLFSYVSAQEQSIMMNDSLSLEQLVISSTRAKETDPFTFQNVGLSRIEKINLGQDPVVLIQELSPSIVSYSDGGTDIGNYSQLRMRGIDQSRINITLNGVPLNDMADHGTYFSNFSDFGNSIESIQIQRGAGSTQKGTASYGGAINFESSNIFRPDSKGEVQVTIGSFGTLRTAAEISTGKSENGLGFYGRMTKTETGGYKDNSGSDSYSLFFSGGRVSNSEMLKVTAFSGKTQNGQSYLHVPLDIIQSQPRTNFNDINDVDDFEQHMVQFQYARYMDNNTSISGTAYYNGAGGVFPFSFGGDQYMYGLENNHYGVLANFEKRFSKNLLSIGAHSYLFKRTNFEYITPLVTEPYARDFTDKSEFSAFTKFAYNQNDLSFYINGEIRTLSMDLTGDENFGSDLNIENSWTFLNGSIGVNYALNTNSSTYMSISHTNREPTRSDILNGVDKSESVVDLELGWKYAMNNFSLDANLFLMSFKNEISNIGALEDLSYMEIRQNVDKSSRYGIEGILQYALNSKLSAGMNLAWMNSNIKEYNNGNIIFNDVKHVFAANWTIQPSISYSFTDNMSFRLSSRYVSESFSELSNNEEFVLPSHFVMNAQLNLSVAERLDVSVMLNNIFDNLYFTEGGPIDVDFDGVVEGMGFRIQPPRHFYLMLKYSL